MAVYRYSAPSLLDEVSVVTNNNGGRRAYFHAREDASSEALTQMRAELKAVGLKAVATLHEGKAALEVLGFGKEDEIIKLAHNRGWIAAQPSVAPINNDTRTTRDKLENLTLKATGAAYNIGDMAFMTYTLKERNYYHKKLKTALASGHEQDIISAKESVQGSRLKIGAGLGYAIGGIILSFYASRDQSQQQIKVASQKLDHFFHQAAIAPDDNSAIKDVTQKEKVGFFKKVHNLLSRYPSEALNLVYIGVGALLTASSIKQIVAGVKPLESQFDAQRRLREEKWDVGLGAITAASAFAGLTIPEKKPDEDQEKRTGIGGVIDWIREKPLRATGYGFMVATAFHAKATIGKWRNGDPEVKNTIFGRGIFVVMNVVAEVIMYIS